MEEGAMTVANGSGARAACGALVAVVGLALVAPACGARDAAAREPIELEPSIFDDAARAAIDGGQRLWGRR
jgi:hypothetical protein